MLALYWHVHLNTIWIYIALSILYIVKCYVCCYHKLLFCPWDSPDNTGVGCCAPLQGIFLTRGSSTSLKSLALAGRVFTTSATWEAHLYVFKYYVYCYYKLCIFNLLLPVQRNAFLCFCPANLLLGLIREFIYLIDISI